LPHGDWVGLASPAVRREEDRELTFEVGDGVTGSGTAMGALPVVSRPKEGSATGLVRRGRGRRLGSGTTMGALPVASRPKAGPTTGLARWRGVEGGDRGTEGGDVDGTASREAAAQRAGNLGNLMAQSKISL
jgi:hypothetical protein